MPRPVPLLGAAALALALAGCDTAVQARYHPTSVDEVYGFGSHVSGVTGETYELPARPPATTDADVLARDCNPPGQVFKPDIMVGLRNDPLHYTTLEPIALAAWQEPGLSSPKPGKPYALYGWQPATERGAREDIRGEMQGKAVDPGRSLYRGDVTRMGAYRGDVYSWCDDKANLR